MIYPLLLSYDSRINAHALTAEVDYRWYIEKTTGAEENLAIQRKIISGRKAYRTLRADLKRGCTLPPIVLAFHSEDFEFDFAQPIATTLLHDPKFLKQISDIVHAATAEQIQIVDGLQRTNAMREAAEELDGGDLALFLDRPLRVEIWLNIPFFALAYRMLLLNAGQRPMSMKHQIEILGGNMASELRDIPNLRILTSLAAERRVQPGQFQLSRLVESFQAWLQGRPNIDLQNLIAEQLLMDEAVESLGAGLSSQTEGAGQGDYKAFLTWLVEVDLLLGRDYLGFLQNETVVQGLSAAVGNAQRTDSLRGRLGPALDSFKEAIRIGGAEAAGVDLFETFRKGIDPKKRNVGDATRDLVYKALREYIVSAGTNPMRDCWAFAASVS